MAYNVAVCTVGKLTQQKLALAALLLDSSMCVIISVQYYLQVCVPQKNMAPQNIHRY